MTFERESILALIAAGGAAVFLCACALAAGVGLSLLMWGAL